MCEGGFFRPSADNSVVGSCRQAGIRGLHSCGSSSRSKMQTHAGDLPRWKNLFRSDFHRWPPSALFLHKQITNEKRRSGTGDECFVCIFKTKKPNLREHFHGNLQPPPSTRGRWRSYHSPNKHTVSDSPQNNTNVCVFLYLLYTEHQKLHSTSKVKTKKDILAGQLHRTVLGLRPGTELGNVLCLWKSSQR